MADVLDAIREFTDPELEPSIVGAQREGDVDYYLVLQDGSGVRLLSAYFLGYLEIDTKLGIISRFNLGGALLDWLTGAKDDDGPVKAETPIPSQKPKPATTSAQDAANDKMFDTAVWGVNNPQMNSKTLSPKETKKGKLACAWAVNRIAKFALGSQIGGGLQTAAMIKVLRASHGLVAEGNAVPGCVIISPTQGGNIGHVGVFGAGMKIYSNSSSAGMWLQTHSLTQWKNYYGAKKGLQVHFYQLNPGKFPAFIA